jgi:ADP-ribose pyrophosphatase YjhB (NUDIX family)
MAGIAVNVAVLDQDKVLLTQREDFETWILPSGSVGQGESLAQAAIRVANEQTGLDVELTRLVGVYSRLSNISPAYTIVFAARPIGGQIALLKGETMAVQWFCPNELPCPLSAGHRRRIGDALSGVTGVVVLQRIKFKGVSTTMSRRKLLQLRDRSGLSHKDFYIKTFERAKVKEIVEVSGSAGPSLV